MTEDTHPIAGLTDAALEALLKRAMRVTLVLGALAAAAVWLASDWRNAAMIATGAVISAASVLEWQRLIRVINARMDKQRTPASTPVVVLFFVLRLTIFAAIIYSGLKYFHGSITALLCGLCLAVLTIGWEAIRLLRD